jgi:hypothetical protein
VPPATGCCSDAAADDSSSASCSVPCSTTASTQSWLQHACRTALSQSA